MKELTQLSNQLIENTKAFQVFNALMLSKHIEEAQIKIYWDIILLQSSCDPKLRKALLILDNKTKEKYNSVFFQDLSLLQYFTQAIQRIVDEIISLKKGIRFDLEDLSLITSLSQSGIKKNQTIGIIGDSVSFGLKSDFNYGQYIQKATGAMIKNLAISGAHLCDNGYNSIYQQSVRLDTSDLCIFQTTDDDWLANVPIGSKQDLPHESYIGAFYHTIEQLKRKQKKIMILTPTLQSPVKGDRVRRTDKSKNKLGYDLHDYVTAVRAACQDLTLPLVELMTAKLFNPADQTFRKNVMPDGLHPNSKGHKIIAKEIAKVYQTDLQKKSSD